MAERTNLRPIGVIENMSYYVCPHCGERDDIFGDGRRRRRPPSTLGVPLMAQVPLVPALRAGGDSGAPIVVTDPDAPASVALREGAHAVARATKSKVGQAADAHDERADDGGCGGGPRPRPRGASALVFLRRVAPTHHRFRAMTWTP